MNSNRSVGRPATTRAANTVDGPGDRDNRNIRFVAGDDQTETGVGDQRRARIADQRHAFAAFQPFHQARADPGGVVFVIGHQGSLDSVADQEGSGHPGILAGHEIDPGEDAKRPEGDVVGMSDRGRHDVEAGVRASVGRFTRPRLADRLPIRWGMAIARADRGGG